MKPAFRFHLPLALACCSLLPAAAQTAGNGNITGTVKDPSGAIVPGATVIVINTDTNIRRTVTSDKAGVYTAPFLLPGHYEIQINAPGFAPLDNKNITLIVGQILTVDGNLAPAGETTQVEVTSQPTILDTEKTEVSQALDTHLIGNLPVNNRNWSSFVLNTPHVTQDGGSGLVSFHGISGLYNQNYVDGANNNQMLFSEARGRASGAPYVYSIDSIKEFQAETSNYSVEFGQAAGGQVNAVTKSGGNKTFGDLFYYLRYPTLNALDPYSKWSALYNHAPAFLLTQPVHQQHQFGGSVGGAIIKDRLFYFFTYDGFRRTGRALYYNTNTISTTATGSYTATTTISPAQCPVVGTSGYNIDGAPATTGITAAQCLAAINFVLANDSAAPTRFQKQNLFFPRIDWHVNEHNDAFVDFNGANYDSTYGYSGSPTFSNSSPSTNGPTSYHERFLVGGLTTQIGTRSVNQIHAQWGRDLETAGANASGPSVGLGFLTYGMPNALPRVAEPDEHRIQFTDVFSTTRGNHTFKFGGDVNIIHEVMINLFQGGGIYNYSGGNNTANFQSWALDSFAGQPGDTDPFAGYHYTSFVQTVDQVNKAAGTQGKDDFWMKLFDVFAEDTWKVSPTFTLTAGVRWDVQFTPAPGQVNNNFAPLSTYYSQTIKNVMDRVQPRVGFSWQPYTGTVVRGGYGIFSGLNQGSTYYAMRVENGVVQVNYNYNGCGANNTTSPAAPKQNDPTQSCLAAPAAGSALTYPNLPFQPTGPSLSAALYPSGGTAPSVSGPTTLGAQSFHGLDPNFVPPISHEVDLSVEQALPGKLSLQVGYVGTRGLHLPVFLDANLIGQTPHGIRTYNVLNAAGAVQSQITVPVYLPSDRRNTSLASYNTGFSIANTLYNGLGVTVRRAFQNGLEVLGNYTWSHALDDGQVGGANGTFYGGDTPSDPNNIKADYGNSDTDIRNRFTLSFTYQPHLFESSKWAKTIVDGFKFSGTEIASGGQPIFLGVTNTIYSGSTSATSYAADGGIYGGAMSSSSGAATNGRPPYVGRNSIYAPGFNNFDLRVSRQFPIHENIMLELSAEAFNLLNHTIITGVQSTYSTYLSAGATGVCSSSNVAAPAGSTLQGCFEPYTGTGSSGFGATSSTNNSLYGPRQMQFIAKMYF